MPSKRNRKSRAIARAAQPRAAHALPGARFALEAPAAAGKSAGELALEAAVFGGDDFERVDAAIAAFGEEEDAVVDGRVAEAAHAEDDAPLFVIDTAGAPDQREHDDDAEPAPEKKKRRAVWIDDDAFDMNIADVKRLRKLRTSLDETHVSNTEYEARLRRQFEKTHGRHAWAEVPAEGNSDGDIFSTTRSVLARAHAQLKPELIEVVRVTDANTQAQNQSVVSNIDWHPTLPILLTCGRDRTLRIFQIDGKTNPKLQSFTFRDFPIARARFTADGNQIIVTGLRRHFYVFDMESGSVEKIHRIQGRDEKRFSEFCVSPCNTLIAFIGSSGFIVLVSRQTKQWVADLKMNGSINAVCFSRDGKFLYSLGDDGEIYQWDVAARRCVNRVTDDGAVKPTTIAVSHDGAWLVTGASSGAVNVYRADTLAHSAKPKPAKTLLNLTTAIHGVGFNHDAQLLGIASHTKKDQFRLVHLPSLTAFQNWPTAGTPLGYVSTFAFSADSQYLAVGNDTGKVLLYQLKHYLK